MPALVALPQRIECRLRHRRGEILRRDSVAASDNLWHRRAVSSPKCLGERRDHIQVQGLAWRPHFFGLLEDGNALDRQRQRREKMGGRERPIKADLQDTELLALA